MHLLLLAAGALLASSEALALTIPAKETTVQIKNGTVVGKYVDSFQQDLFLGIPFAQPPIDDLRFNMPQPINETWDTPLNATEYDPECIQYRLSIGIDFADITYPQSEDCLTINVIRPAGTTNQSKLPVLVWIYGGGFQEGGTADGRYNTSYMVQNSVAMGQPTISVTINYRLDGWGLLAGDDVRGQGLLNLGLYDQRLALRWIQENIEAFGGDNTRVTLQGESAGAMSIGYHMLAYGGRNDGLFSAAICQSGGPWFFASYPTPAQSEENYQSVLEATNCTGAHNSIACLRAAPFDVLNSVFGTLEFSTVPDGSLIPEYNSVALARGNFVKVPLLIGANTDEGKLFSSYGVNTTEEFRELIQSNPYVHTQNNDTADRLMEAYPEQGSSSLHGQSDDTIQPAFPYGTQFTRVARYIGDVMFIAGRRYTCELWAQHGLPCYSYRFNTVPANTDPIARGATHFTDIAFTFNNVIGTGMDESAFAVTPAAREQNYVQLGSLMSRMWTSFANSHSPNNHKLSTFNTTWPQYSLDAPTNIVFDGNSTSFIETDDFRSEAMKLIIESALDFDR